VVPRYRPRTELGDGKRVRCSPQPTCLRRLRAGAAGRYSRTTRSAGGQTRTADGVSVVGQVLSIAPLVDRLLASKGSRRRSRTFPMRLAHLNTAGHRAWRVRRATPRTSMSRGSWPGHRDPGRRVDGRTNRQGPVRVAGSEKAAAHRLGLSHSTVKHHLANARSKVGATTTAQLVWILGPRLLEPDGVAQPEE